MTTDPVFAAFTKANATNLVAHYGAIFDLPSNSDQLAIRVAGDTDPRVALGTVAGLPALSFGNGSGTGLGLFVATSGLLSLSQVALLASVTRRTVAKTAAWTWALTERDAVITSNSAGNVAATIPPNSDVAFQIGQELRFTNIHATGTVTITAGAGVTLRVPPGFPALITGQYSHCTLRQTATDEWVLVQSSDQLGLSLEFQPINPNLTTISGLTATTNNFMVASGSAWASRTPTQAIAHLGLDADIATFALPASTTISTYGATLVDDADAATARTTLGGVPLALTPVTAVTASTHTAAVNTIVPLNTTSNAIAVTLPTAPTDGSVIVLKAITISGINLVTYTTGGSDVLNKASGPTSGVMTFTGQEVTLQYQTSTAIWHILTPDPATGAFAASDGTAAHGKAVTLVNVLGQSVSLFGDTGDTQPKARLLSTGIDMGPGGSTATDFKILRTGSAAATVTGVLTMTSPVLVTPALGVATGTSLAATGAITSSSPTAGVGYATGAGGTVTQGAGAGRTATVVLNALSGTITLLSTTLAADTDQSFTWTNSAIAATDVVVTSIKSGAAVKGGYSINVSCGSGTATVTVHNLTPTITTTEAPVIAFVVIKGVTS